MSMISKYGGGTGSSHVPQVKTVGPIMRIKKIERIFDFMAKIDANYIETLTA